MGRATPKQNNIGGNLYCIILAVIPLILFILRVSGGYIAGSRVDWIGQHSVFPDYFRKLFYRTGNLFPQFAREIGGGQNIYNFAYYGLYNPLYLLSYLFPFVKMSVYLQVITLAEEIADGLLCYHWLRRRRFAGASAFFGACVLALAIPLAHHSSTQLMFVNYMPFLLLMLIAYDRYRETGKYLLLTVSVLFMILCSFYFALGGVVVLYLYGASEESAGRLTKTLCDWFRRRKTTGQTLRAGMEEEGRTPLLPAFLAWVRESWDRFYPALFGCLLSLFYLIPVYMAMTVGRKTQLNVSLSKLLIPYTPLRRVLYDRYGMGMTAVAVVALFTALFYQKCRERRIAWWLLALLVFPVCTWFLNGGLYLRDKAFIPFIPLFSYLVAAFYERLRLRMQITGKQITGMQLTGGQITGTQITGKQILCGFLLAAAFLFLACWRQRADAWDLLLVDLLLCAAALRISWRSWRGALILVSVLTMALFSISQVYRGKALMVEQSFINGLEDTELSDAAAYLLDKDRDAYRMEVRENYTFDKDNQNRILALGQNLTTCYSSVSNADYHIFRTAVLQIDKPSRNGLMEEAVGNPIFLRVMGVRYLLGSHKEDGYRKAESFGTVSIYKNENVAPLAYVTDQILSEKQFDALSYPQRQLAMLSCAVVKDAPERELSLPVEERKLPLAAQSTDALQIAENSGEYRVTANAETETQVPLGSAIPMDGYLFLTFRVQNENPSEDVEIRVNGQRNKLSQDVSANPNDNFTFHYTVAVKAGQTAIRVSFGKGTYILSDVSCWSGSEDRAANQTLYASPVHFTAPSDETTANKDEAMADNYKTTVNTYTLRADNRMEGTFTAASDGMLVTSIPYDSSFTAYIDGEKVQTQKVNEAFIGLPATKGSHKLTLIFHAPGRTAGLIVTVFVITLLVLDLRRRKNERLRKLVLFG